MDAAAILVTLVMAGNLLASMGGLLEANPFEEPSNQNSPVIDIQANNFLFTAGISGKSMPVEQPGNRKLAV